MRSISRSPSTLQNLQSYPKGLRYDELWYLQRTEKFIYNDVSETLPDVFEGTDCCYEMRPRPGLLNIPL